MDPIQPLLKSIDSLLLDIQQTVIEEDDDRLSRLFSTLFSVLGTTFYMPGYDIHARNDALLKYLYNAVAIIDQLTYHIISDAQESSPDSSPDPLTEVKDKILSLVKKSDPHLNEVEFKLC